MLSLPFADLILLSNACSIAVIVSTLLAIKFLGEKFIWQYDLPALFMICVGSMLTIRQSNLRSESIDYEMAVQMIFSFRTASIILIVIIFAPFTLFVRRRFLKKLEDFARSAHEWKSTQ